jgi:flagellar hook-length control protein FliK
MNATPLISQAPITTDPTQISGSTAADSAKPAGNGRDFAAALSDAGAKSSRKPAASKDRDGGTVGRQLPATGNNSPPPAAPAPTPAGTSAAATRAAAADAEASKAAMDAAVSKAAMDAAAANSATAATGAAAAVASAAASAAAAAGAAAASAAAASAAANSAAAASAATMAAGGGDAALRAGASGAAAISSAQVQAAANGSGGALQPANMAPGSAAAAANTGAAFAEALGLPAAPVAGTQNGANAPVTQESVAVPSAVAQAITNPGAGHVSESAPGSSAPKTRSGATADRLMQPNAASSQVSAANEGATSSANIAPPPNDNPVAPTPAAVAMSAAASGAVAPSPVAAAETASSRADDSSTPAVGGTGQQAAGATGLAPPASAVTAATAASTAAATAAAAKTASLAAVTALGATVGSDRHSRGQSSDSTTSTTVGLVAGSAPSASTGSGDATPLPTFKVAAGVDSPEFGQGVADRVSLMVDNNLNGAKLQVNPPQLGPIEVRIAVQGGHAQVWLTSHSAVTRDALESSSPKLREMLGSQGFGQVSVDISQRSFQERPSQAQTYDWTPSSDRIPSAAPVSAAAASLSRISSGAVDAYA